MELLHFKVKRQTKEATKNNETFLLICIIGGI